MTCTFNHFFSELDPVLSLQRHHKEETWKCFVDKFLPNCIRLYVIVVIVILTGTVHLKFLGDKDLHFKSSSLARIKYNDVNRVTLQYLNR